MGTLMFEYVKEPNNHEFIILKPDQGADLVLECIREHALLLRLSRLDGEFAYVSLDLICREFPSIDHKRINALLEVLVTASFLRHSRSRFHVHNTNQGFAITEQGEVLLAQLREGREKRIRIRGQDRWLFR